MFWTLWIDALLSSEQESEALRVAEQAVQQSSAPEVLLKAAAVTFLNAEMMAQPARAEELHRQAFAMNSQALVRAQTDPRREDELREAIVTAHLHMAMSHARLGDLHAAQQACDKALSINPSSLDAMLVRGFIQEQARARGAEARASVTRRLIQSDARNIGSSPVPNLLPHIQSLFQS
jgi:tetratricopeptide (TPR) repeat protein